MFLKNLEEISFCKIPERGYVLINAEERLGCSISGREKIILKNPREINLNPSKVQQRDQLFKSLRDRLCSVHESEVNFLKLTTDNWFFKNHIERLASCKMRIIYFGMSGIDATS